jgi:nucleoside-diphosphate-sugar epimerase
MHVLILGGTGFSGQALIRHFDGERPTADFTVVSRTATALPGVRRVFTGHYADLLRSPAFRSELSSVDAIVHLADGLSILQNREHAAAAQVDSLVAPSRDLAVAARDARVPLFVHVSSIKALCDEEDSRILVEASEPRGTTLYGRSKLQLEEALAGALAGSDTRLVTVRNPVMYDRGKRGSLNRLVALADTPLPLPLGGLFNRRSVLALRNFASALAAIVRTTPSGPQGVFHVHDGPALSTTEIVATLRAALGRPARLFQVGATAAHAARRIPVLSPIARRLFGSLELSDAHFRQCFRWTPVVETRAALSEMVR